MNDEKKTFKKLRLFIYNNEYNILDVSGVFCGFILMLIANGFFVNSPIYYLLFFLGLGIGSLGFIIEYYIKNEKRKILETEFSYFLYDLSKEYKKTRNFATALRNLLEHNFYGGITYELRKLTNRVSWGESFEDALSAINVDINSPIISHSLVLFNVLKKSAISYDKILENISKDIKIFKSEDRNKKYFSNLFYLSIVFYFIFVFVLIYINHIIGSNFLWVASQNSITRFFFDNFILYITLLLGIFTSYVMYSIKKDKGIYFIKYVFIIFISTIVLFQIFVPKPDAERVIVDTINYMIKNNESNIELNKIIALKTISSKFLTETTGQIVYFYNLDNESKDNDTPEYAIFINEPSFFDFVVEIKENSVFYIYYKRR